MKKILVGIAAVSMVVMTSSAFGAAMLILDEDNVGPFSVIAEDNLAAGSLSSFGGMLTTDNDNSATLGFLSVTSSTFGAWTVTTSGGSTKPLLGSASTPNMDLFNVSVSGGVGDLYVWFSDTDFTGNQPGGILDFGGTTDGTISFSAWYSSSNDLFGVGTVQNILTTGTFGPGSFSGSATGAMGSAQIYGLTLGAIIHHTDAGQITSFDAEFNVVPEPATLLLLGTGLIGIAGVRRRMG